MTTPETRTRLQQLEDRLAERTPPPLDGQTRIPLPPPPTADTGNEGSGGNGKDDGNGGNGADGGTSTP
ncbi:hypothetical protein [Streptomyces lavendofoliae]|uniref:hypothetical protein n=1 Tax=Streptomyces lavendofoliae TaxID=67314 RepID=UPI00300F0D23